MTATPAVQRRLVGAHSRRCSKHTQRAHPSACLASVVALILRSGSSAHSMVGEEHQRLRPVFCQPAVMMAAKLYEWIFGAKAGMLWPHLFSTLGSTFVGLIVAVATGFAVGMLFSQHRRLANVLSPFIVALNSLPRIAFVPLITMIFGLGMASEVVTAWFIVFSGVL